MVLELNEFESQFLLNFKNHSKECINDIKKYDKLIQNYFNEKGDTELLQDFIQKINDVIVEESSGDFNFFETVLRQDSFNYIFEKFKDSDVMVRACQLGNKKALKWLITLDINASVQDERGATALMYASQQPELRFVVQHLCQLGNDKSIQLVDEKRENALFYAVHNLDSFRILLNAGVDVNCLNKDNDSILIYCCRNKIYEPIRSLSVINNLDVNIYNDKEKTAAMYLIEDGRFLELKYLINYQINLYYTNANHESAMTILFKKYYEHYQKQELDQLLGCVNIIKVLVNKGISLNTSIDEDGNTPLLFLMMVEDWITFSYILLRSKDVDLTIKNKHGISPNLYSLQMAQNKRSKEAGINMKRLATQIIQHRTFDFDYKDKMEHDILTTAIMNGAYDFAYALLKERPYFALKNDFNNQQETPLIIITKFGIREVASQILNIPNNPINYQDQEGNTALHYAVLLNDYYFADILAEYHADINIKNNEGLSPLDIATKSGDSTMIQFLSNPIPHLNIAKIEQRQNNKKSGNKISSIFKKRLPNYEFRGINGDLRSEYMRKYEIMSDIEDSRVYPYKQVMTGIPTSFYHSFQRKAFETYFTVNMDRSQGWVTDCEFIIVDFSKMFNLRQKLLYFN